MISTVAVAITARGYGSLLRLRMGFQQLFDEAAGFHFVEQLDTLTEPFHGEAFDVLFVKSVVVDGSNWERWTIFRF